MRILFGVGNPGPEYDQTRHNLGFEVLNRMAGEERFTALPGLPAAAARIECHGQGVLLVRPLTFVNRCGPVLATLLRLTATGVAETMVAVDDLDLQPGRVRMRAGGSAGGHNGLRSIAAALGTDAYPRLRIGIGGPGAGPRADYVLAPFPEAERRAVQAALARAREGLDAWLSGGLELAMETTNRRDLDPGLERL